MPKKNINRLLKDTFFIVCKKPKELNIQPIEHKGNNSIKVPKLILISLLYVLKKFLFIPKK